MRGTGLTHGRTCEQIEPADVCPDHDVVCDFFTVRQGQRLNMFSVVACRTMSSGEVAIVNKRPHDWVVSISDHEALIQLGDEEEDEFASMSLVWYHVHGEAVAL